MIQWCERICFLICFCFWFVLLFCRLLRRDHGELVFVKKHNPSSSMMTLHVLCDSRLYEGIDMKIFRDRRDEDWRSIFDAG